MAETNEVVTFTAENPPPVNNEVFSLVSPQTNLQGVAISTLSTTIATFSSFSVRATTAGGGTAVLVVTLQP